jgi:hypothetical protein
MANLLRRPRTLMRYEQARQRELFLEEQERQRFKFMMMIGGWILQSSTRPVSDKSGRFRKTSECDAV